MKPAGLFLKFSLDSDSTCLMLASFHEYSHCWVFFIWVFSSGLKKNPDNLLKILQNVLNFIKIKLNWPKYASFLSKIQVSCNIAQSKICPSNQKFSPSGACGANGF